MIDPNDPETLDLVAACEEPLSGAERARRHRLKKKQAGVKDISLTQTDRMVLSLGLLAHEDLHHRPKDWVTSKKPGFDALLKKLWPEGDNGRYLAEPKRSTRRPTAFLRDELERQKGMVKRLDDIYRDMRGENQRLQEALQQIAAEVGAPPAASVVVSPVGQPLDGDALTREIHFLTGELNKATAEVDRLTACLQAAQAGEDFATLDVTDARLQPVWDKLPTDFARCATALGLLRQRNNQHAELAHAVEVLQERLRAAGLNDRVNDNKQEWHWNTCPFVDYRATSAPESMERISRKRSPADDRAALAQRVEALEKEQALLEAERNKAFAANRTLTERLRRAGLPTDYRPQPGE